MAQTERKLCSNLAGFHVNYSDFRINTNQFWYFFFFFGLSLKTDTPQFKEMFKHVLNFKCVSNPSDVVLLSIQKSHD